ncbi:glycosyltransferase [Nonlabens agnitus]|uniref:Glycosyl transferase family 1 domain-containing protein n=1 Tax=Nonlabens agnitus TaxID=870484 RepID=A0A2S9WU32_9FLAO|nr:hypothetical protein BST86_07635 [Nonlabens agnitus]
MNLLVISDAHLLTIDGKKVAYAPYIKEMDLWMDKVCATTIVSPDKLDGFLLYKPFARQDFRHIGTKRLEFHKISSAITSLFSIPFQIWTLYLEMKKADHIHLRAPGNLALLAGLVAISLPRKRKSVKYAGNWDPNSKQPLSYRWQKRLFSSSKWSKNTKVMAYGQWKNQSENIVPFFTASYSKTDRKVFLKELVSPVQIIFVGTISKNKNPQLLIELIEGLHEHGIAAQAHFYGDGPMMHQLKQHANPTMATELSRSQPQSDLNAGSSLSTERSRSQVEDSSTPQCNPVSSLSIERSRSQVENSSKPQSNPVSSDSRETDGDSNHLSPLKKRPSHTERSRSEDNGADTDATRVTERSRSQPQSDPNAGSSLSTERSRSQVEDSSTPQSNPVSSLLTERSRSQVENRSEPQSNPVSSDSREMDGSQNTHSFQKKPPSRTEPSQSEDNRTSNLSPLGKCPQDNGAFTFHGNQPAEVVKKAYKQAHFLFLASQSEGWPKAVAEAMWHGCVPIASPVSCVPWMLNNNGDPDLETLFQNTPGQSEPVEDVLVANKLKAKSETPRGLIFTKTNHTITDLQWLINNPDHYQMISQAAQTWSQQYTLEDFEKEIVKLLKNQI